MTSKGLEEHVFFIKYQQLDGWGKGNHNPKIKLKKILSTSISSFTSQLALGQTPLTLNPYG